MESFGKKAKNAIRAAVLGGAVISGAAGADTGLLKGQAEAQTVTQQTSGSNSPNIFSGGNVTIQGLGENGHPNISTNTEGSIQQRSEHESSPNIITNGDVVIIDGKVFKKQ